MTYRQYFNIFPCCLWSNYIIFYGISAVSGLKKYFIFNFLNTFCSKSVFVNLGVGWFDVLLLRIFTKYFFKRPMKKIMGQILLLLLKKWPFAAVIYRLCVLLMRLNSSNERILSDVYNVLLINKLRGMGCFAGRRNVMLLKAMQLPASALWLCVDVSRPPHQQEKLIHGQRASRNSCKENWGVVGNAWAD